MSEVVSKSEKPAEAANVEETPKVEEMTTPSPESAPQKPEAALAVAAAVTAHEAPTVAETTTPAKEKQGSKDNEMPKVTEQEGTTKTPAESETPAPQEAVAAANVGETTKIAETMSATPQVGSGSSKAAEEGEEKPEEAVSKDDEEMPKVTREGKTSAQVSAESDKTAPRKKAIITGITGQDGSYLAEFLLEMGYEVHGIIRRSSSFNTQRIDHIYRDSHESAVRLKLHYGDLTDSTNLMHIIYEVQPDEIYNLGAMSHVKVSFEMSEYTAECDGVGVLRLLNAIRSAGLEKKTRLYQASTSELYGKVQEIPQKETTPFYPRSPYGVAKQFGYWMLINYREAYGMHLTNGILFNHESPRRGPTFVTRKITRAVARIHRGKQKTIYLGNLDAKRDWGHAKDYIKGMWLMVQRDEPDDYVLSTGECHSVKEFVEEAFKYIGMEITWVGEGVEEYGHAKGDPENVLVKVDPRYFRPTEVELLLGDCSKAKRELGWVPEITFEELVKDMMKSDIAHVDAGNDHL